MLMPSSRAFAFVTLLEAMLEEETCTGTLLGLCVKPYRDHDKDVYPCIYIDTGGAMLLNSCSASSGILCGCGKPRGHHGERSVGALLPVQFWGAFRWYPPTCRVPGSVLLVSSYL
jgi:hypothetical protein